MTNCTRSETDDNKIELQWTTGTMPKRPGWYLCTVYGDENEEYYVTTYFYECRPVSCRNGFFDDKFNKIPDEDIFAWAPFPKPYIPRGEI